MPPEFPSSEMKQPVNLSRRQIDGSGSAWKVPKETPEDQMIALGAKDDKNHRFNTSIIPSFEEESEIFWANKLFFQTAYHKLS